MRPTVIDHGNWPPNIDAIRERFGELPKGVIFAWGGIIYNPSGKEVPPYLIAHEEVHFRQQEEVGGAENWWARYLIDDQWRLEQEIEAHRREYLVYCGGIKDRNARAYYLQQIALRLASPMYGSLISAAEARRRISK